MTTTFSGYGETLLSLSDGTTDITNTQLFKFDKKPGAFTTESVNNYFKSMKEIEAEFLSSMSAATNTLKNMITDLGQFSQHLLFADGTAHFPDPDDIHKGYMEENY